MEERLQKIMSARGIASRRKAEEYITAGLVKVNGKVAILGQKADAEKDVIEVDGKVLEERKEMLYYVMYKPVGVESTNAERSKGDKGLKGQKGEKKSSTPLKPFTPSVRELLPKELQGKIYPVGRLDKDSEGLLLLTNDGVLAYRLMHPKFDHEKEYEVTLAAPIFDGALKKLRDGVMIDDELTKPAKITRLDQNRILIALTEGRNRQIRRMCSKVGSEVIRLVRTRIMTFSDSGLKPGHIRPLTEAERTQLLGSVEL